MKPDPPIETNKALVRRLFAAIENADFPVFDEIVAQDHVDHLAGQTPGLLTREPRVGNGRRVVFMSGNDAGSKAAVGDLLETVGFSPIDLGTLVIGGKRQQAGATLSGMNLVKMS